MGSTRCSGISSLILLLFVLIDTGEHGLFLSSVLQEEHESFTYYDLSAFEGDSYTQMVLALRQAKVEGVRKVALPYILQGCHAGLLEEMKVVGLDIYTSAAYTGMATAACYKPYITTVATLDDKGDRLSTVNYDDAEVIFNGCYGIHCSNSLAAARLAAQ